MLHLFLLDSKVIQLYIIYTFFSNMVYHKILNIVVCVIQ